MEPVEGKSRINLSKVGSEMIRGRIGADTL